MAIQMLAAWNGYEQHAVYTLSNAEETRLIGLGLARNYTGSVVPPGVRGDAVVFADNTLGYRDDANGGAASPISTGSGSVAVQQNGAQIIASASAINIAAGLVAEQLVPGVARIRRSHAWREVTQFGACAAYVSETGQPRVSFNGFMTGGTLTVSSMRSGSGNLFVGAYLEAPGLVGVVKVTALGTGTGTTGTYTVNSTQTLGSAGSTVVFDSASDEGKSFTTDLNTTAPIRVLRRASRFRLRFTTRDRSDALSAFTLSGHVEVPGKNGSPSVFIPYRFGGSTAINVPAGGGFEFVTDWIGWPVEVGDILHAKSYLTNGGNPIVISAPSPLTGAARNPANRSQAAYQNRGSDATTIPYGTSPWIEGTGFLSGGGFGPVAWEADGGDLDRPVSVDFWGDSIGFGAGSTGAPPFLEQICIAAGNPYNSMCIAGTNQTQIPQYARRRLQIARGDIAIVQHGRNSGDTAALSRLWSFLRALGYRRIIQTTATNATNTGNTAFASGGDSSAMRAFQRANVGVGDGPDAIWDVQAALQDPVTGLWLPGLAPADGLHPNDAGNNAVAAYALANNWANDLRI